MAGDLVNGVILRARAGLSVLRYGRSSFLQPSALRGEGCFSGDMMEEFLLFVAGIVAGAIDAVVGGGGLIGIPALLLYGVVPLESLSTNKLQSIVGKVVAITRYFRAGLFGEFSLREMAMRYVLPCLIWGSVGALCATLLDSAVLELWIPVILLVACGYFLWRAWGERKRCEEIENKKLAGGKSIESRFWGYMMLRGISFYDGIFGPGAGTFFLWILTGVRGMGLRGAVALTRVLNMSSNFGALVIFSFAVGFAWRAWFVIVSGQILGALLGSFVVLRISVFWLWVGVSGVTGIMAAVLLMR